VDDVSDEEEEEEHEEHPQANGAATRKGRRISHSSQNIAAPTPRHHNERADRHRASSGGALSAPPNQPLGINAAGTSPHSARETFLNYFFGGQDGQQGPSGQGSRAPVPHLATAVPRGPKTGAREMFPDLGTRGTHGPSSSRGQNNLEPNTAYDMKSLSKHLEAVC
jgi:dynamin 1-like protein